MRDQQLDPRTGNLVLTLDTPLPPRHAAGAALTLIERAPIAWQLTSTGRQPIAVRYTLLRDDSVRFDLGAYDRSQPLYIDPTLEYSSYLGGAGYDTGTAIALDSAGYLYVAGVTDSATLAGGAPTRMGSGGGTDIFILLGGADDDEVQDLAVAPDGRIALTGTTWSNDFPVVNTLQATRAGGRDGVVAVLANDGSSLLYATYLGGTNYDEANGLALLADGTIGGTLFFTQWESASGQELWTSDGTSAGTVLVRDIRPGTASVGIDHLTAMEGVALFRERDGIHGMELWRSDGASAGTQLVADIRPGAADSPITNIRVSGRRVFFSADDGVAGSELWRHQPWGASTRTISYTYDGLARLSGVTESGATTSTYTYTYDLADNRTSATVNGATTTRSYDAANQVVGWQYDAAGNLRNDGTTTRSYDVLGRMTSTGGTKPTTATACWFRPGPGATPRTSLPPEPGVARRQRDLCLRAGQRTTARAHRPLVPRRRAGQRARDAQRRAHAAGDGMVRPVGPGAGQRRRAVRLHGRATGPAGDGLSPRALV